MGSVEFGQHLVIDDSQGEDISQIEVYVTISTVFWVIQYLWGHVERSARLQPFHIYLIDFIHQGRQAEISYFRDSLLIQEDIVRPIS